MWPYRTVGLISAMEEEHEWFIRHMEAPSLTLAADMEFLEGRMHGYPVVAVKCGVGKVNAAVCTQLLVELFDVGAIILTGVAGALHPQLEIGDIVISNESMHHDMDATALGFARGIIPYAEVSIFPSDPDLMQMALEGSRELFVDHVHVGRVLSGDRFIADRDEVKVLHEQLGGICTEMEGAAVAQVCGINCVPYVIIRSISDKANGEAADDFQQFCARVAEHSYRIVDHMMRTIGDRAVS